MSVTAFINQCRAEFPANMTVDAAALAPSVTVIVDTAHWTRAATVARAHGGVFSALWVDLENECHRVRCCLRLADQPLVLLCDCPPGGRLPSIAPIFAAASRPERHAHDLYGIVFAGSPDKRRWTRHRAWNKHNWPLGTAAPPVPSGETPADDRYRFLRARGASVVEVAVGPIHAGIIEPGHFRFHVVGETVLNLEQRLGYTHKGIEHLGRGRDAAGIARLAARVSGDSTVAHSWAACQAIERAAQVSVPMRALWLRALMAERERVANHLGDVGAICNDVGFAFAQAQCSRLRETWTRESHAAFGHRFMMDRIVPGGVSVDLDATAARRMRDSAARFAAEFSALVERLEATESLEDRLMTTGRLAPEQAAELGVTGYVGKASGQSFDARADLPYPPYDQLEVRVPTYHAGDVAARAKVRADEILVSLQLIGKIIDAIPDGDILAVADCNPASADGLGLVEGWRGNILTFVRFGTDGRVERFFPRDPSWLSWPALEILQLGNIIADFPVCNKSVNASYSGQDL